MAVDIAKLYLHYSKDSSEGKFGHLYLDGIGHVTLGVGHLVWKRPKSLGKMTTSITTVISDQKSAAQVTLAALTGNFQTWLTRITPKTGLISAMLKFTSLKVKYYVFSARI